MIASEIAQRRLHNQNLTQPAQTPAEVVRRMGAVQAQDYLGALWAIGLRLEDSTQTDIEQALTGRRIVRTWPLRGTLHFVAAEDVRWILALMAPRIIASCARRYRELELDTEIFVRSNDLLLEALQHQDLNRTQLLAILEQNGISTEGQRAPYLLQRASLEGLICQSVTVRNNPTYMALETALPKTKPLTRDEALSELAWRYFSSRGPATLPDFIWWSGLVAADARAALELIKPRLETHTVDGKTYWFAPTQPQNLPTAHLLPAFDEYLVAYKDRSAVLEPAMAQRVNPNGGLLSPVLVIEGQVVGTWKRTLGKESVAIASSFFTPMSEEQNQAILEAAERYGRFLGKEIIGKD